VIVLLFIFMPRGRDTVPAVTPAAQAISTAVDTITEATAVDPPPPQAQPITAQVPAPPAEAPETVVKWTSTWVNVRERRDPNAPILGILDPGERVDVADLQRGWWAVYLEGEVIGYVARSLLRDSPLEEG
jgi:hypothetical protein